MTDVGPLTTVSLMHIYGPLRRAPLAALVATLLLSGCSSDGQSGDEAPEIQVLGSDFILESAQGFEPVGDSTVYLSFREGEMTELGFRLSAGCNSLGGDFTLSDGVMVTSFVSMTEMACQQELMEQDDWLVGFMTSGPSFALEGSRLTLSNADATLVFLDREIAIPDRALVGATWAIDTLIEGEGAAGTASAVNIPEDPTVAFGEDGSLSVFTACTNGVGSYTLSGNAISLGPVGYDEVMCSSTSLEWVDAHIKQVLSEGTITYEIDATRLTLERGGLGLSGITD